MVWAKTPVAMGSILCAACLAVATTTTPAAERAADQLAKTVEAGVDLKVDLTQLASVNAIPIFQALAAATTPAQILAALGQYGATSALPFLAAIAQGDLVTGLTGLASVNALLPSLAFGLTGDVTFLAPLASVNAIPIFQALATATTPEEAVTALGGYGATSALPAFQALGQATTPDEVVDALGGLSLTDAAPAFRDFAATGNTDAFVPTGTPAAGGYAALSGLSSYRDAAAGNPLALGGIAAFSAIPAYLAPDPNAATAQVTTSNVQSNLTTSNVQSGGGTTLAATGPSAGGTTLAANGPSAGGTTLAANNQSGGGTTLAATGPSGGGTALAANGPSGGGTTLAANGPSGGGTDPVVVKTTEPTGNQPNGSYSASFSPTIIPVFGSGGGKNSPDNGMRGYGAIANGLRAAVGLGPDTSGQGAP
jgi:hypothetical protein